MECLTGAACDWDGDDTPGTGERQPLLTRNNYFTIQCLLLGGTACLNYVGCFGCDYGDVPSPIAAGRRRLGNKCLAEGFVPPFFVNKVFAGKSA